MLAGTGKTTAEMKAKETFTNTATEGLDESWDFSDVWGITLTVNDGYPCLVWQHNNCLNTDTDDDGISSQIENAAPNSGDANNDGIPDASQPNVASFVNPVNSKYAVLEVDAACAINMVTNMEESANAVSDSGFNYPAGMMNFIVDCGTPGFTTTVTQYYYDISNDNLLLRKHNPSTNAYFTVSGATIEQVVVGGQTATKVTFQITDGSDLDTDNTENGVIVDPAGLALAAVGVPSTGFGGVFGKTKR